MLNYQLAPTTIVRDALHLAPHGCNFPMVAHFVYDV